ncbi:MAG: Radical SAM domain protein [Candidatus Scalindua rubra]|uniref:Radical SAM domain protein n=1 Tax=Candidatus Scalindua rubra TaxID=1872076 RepID=A0A1E3XB15_9BACT|nr:MAG: Radical SAM domain protein [Candidatus Scalindua rubra]
MMASRGCVYKCTFCSPHTTLVFGKGVRYRTVGSVIDELKVLRDKYNFRSLKFYDYTFTANAKWVREFCDEYMKNGFTQPFICQSRADLICIREDCVKQLSETGLKLMLVGFESGNQRVLDFLKKGTKVEHNLKAAEICKKYGILIGASFMLGIPTETREEALQTVKLAKQMRADFASVSFFTPIPGSSLYDYCLEK